MGATDLWNAKSLELLARRGRITYEMSRLKKQLRDLDEQIVALDLTSEMAAGLDQPPPPAVPPDPPEPAKP